MATSRPPLPKTELSSYKIRANDLVQVTLEHPTVGPPRIAVSGSSARLNNILQSINGRISQVESSVSDINNTASAKAHPTTQVQPVRVLGTVYQNANSTPMFITVQLNLPANSQVTVNTDSSNPPATIIANVGNGAGGAALAMPVSFWVLAGNFYEVINILGAPVINRWTEWT